MDKSKVMISQPIAGMTDEEIKATRDRAKKALDEMGFEFVNTLFTDERYSQKSMEERGVVNIPICFLASSVENMAKCHAACFCPGWENARGCKIEHEIALAYSLDIYYMDDEGNIHDSNGDLII